MPSLTSNEFWVIFDTCTLEPYYQDLHNLLALPRGAVMRYEYTDDLLSEAALRRAANPATAPSKVLLVYGQKPGYTRGGGDAKAEAPASDLAWVATRFATLQAIPANGAHFFFDFTVDGYPKLDSEAIKRILAPLMAESETPFHKWVAVSDDLSAYNDLKRGDEESNWQAIVNRLSADDMQFQNDSFWRLRPFNAAAHAKLVADMETVEDSQQVRKVSSRYELQPDVVCSFEAISHSLEGRPSTRVLKIEFDEDSPLALEGASKGSASIDLRQYTAEIFKFCSRRSEEKVATLSVSFKTASEQTAWPDGPNFELVFRVYQQRPDAAAGEKPRQLEAAAPGTPVPAIPAEVKPQPEPAAGKDPANHENGDPSKPPEPAKPPDSTTGIPTPWTVLQAAIKVRPEVGFALGVAGIASVAAIGKSYFQSSGEALVGTIAVFVLAVLLFLFSLATRSAKGSVASAATFLTWSVAVIFVLALLLFVTTVFAKFPMPYPDFVQQFQPTKLESITVLVQNKTDHKPIKGAVISWQSPDGLSTVSTDENGKASLRVRLGEGIVGTITAEGYENYKAHFGLPDPNVSYTALLSPVPVVKPPGPAPKPGPTKISAASNMNGTWQVVVNGDINNVRLRDGTFQFQPQGNGETIVNANFALDDMRVTLSGTATATGSQVFLKFTAKTDAGGSWSGAGTLTMKTSTQMSGRIRAKAGDNVPVTLKKITQ